MFPEPQFINSNGIRMAVHQQGHGAPVLLLHGFPELAYSWRHQLPALAAAGYRAIAPDLRGYGHSDKPRGVEAYTMQTLIADITGLLDALDIQDAWVVAHDWGAILAWQMALEVPERLRGLAALNVPFIPRPPSEPIALMRAALGDDFYIVNFQDSDAADRACDQDPARVFDIMMRKHVITRARFDTLPKDRRVFSLLKALARRESRGEALLSPAEAAVYTDAFAAGGFTGPINWYRNWTRNWEQSADVEQRVSVPCLFIGARNDVIVTEKQIAAMPQYVPELEIEILEQCGHWSQQEQPAAVNRLLIDWIGRRSQRVTP